MTKVKGRRGEFYWVDGQPYVSVTKIISVLDKPALRYWFGQQVYRAFAADPGLSEKDALSAPYQTSNKAKDRGTTVHSIVEAWKQSQAHIDTIPDQFKGYAEAFYEFVKTNHVKVIENERTVVSKKYGFAGTLDVLANINGNETPLIIDVKTGKGLYPEVQLQLSAYQQGLKENGINANLSALLLREDGSFEFARYTDSLLPQFLACKTIWEWQNADLLADTKKYAKQPNLLGGDR
jgi:hypothetical protein